MWASSKFLVLVLISLAQASHIFDVYRMFQMERDSMPFGSHRTNLNLLATSITTADQIEHIKSLNQLLVMVPINLLNSEFFQKAVSKNAEGILVIIPKNANNEIISKWKSIESELLTSHFKIPIYFTYEDDAVTKIYQDSASRFDASHLLQSEDRYQLSVSGAESAQIKDISVTNFQSFIPATSDSNVEGKSTPTIAIVTYYDSFGVVPGLAIGSESSASNIVAVTELSRLFSKLYSSPQTQGKYNLLFVVTGAGSLNFAGSKYWLSNSDVRLLDSIEFAICLDTIGSGNELNLHLSKISKEEALQGYYESFNTTAQHMKIKLNTVQKKINISNPDIDWEHEQFSRKKIPAVTVSRLATPVSTLAKSHAFDDKTAVNLDSLERNIKFIAEVLAKQIYNFTKRELDVFEGSLRPNRRLLESWLDTFTSSPRSTPYLTKNSPAISAISKLLKLYSTEVNTQTFSLESEFKFYEGVKTSMYAYKVKPPTFDILLAVVIAAYLLVLFIVIKGPSEAIAQLKGIFSKSTKKTYVAKKKN